MGSGGREHALARLLARSSDVVVTPGNPGMPAEVSGHSISVTAAPPEEIGARLTVIGPEAPLVDGMADRLRARGMAVVGPGADEMCIRDRCADSVARRCGQRLGRVHAVIDDVGRPVVTGEEPVLVLSLIHI